MPEVLLSTRGLICERDERLLFDGLDVEFESGRVYRVEGPNGTGKTTLLKILAGLFSSYDGSIFWHDKPLQRQREAFLEKLLFLGHLPGVKKSLTAIENLRWMCNSQDSYCSEDKLMSALQKVGLYGFEDVLCNSLSAGQHRRVALARLYVTSKPLWILDEPFTAIDKQGVQKLENLMAEHAEKGGCVILTTHHDLQIDGVVPIRLKEAV